MLKNENHINCHVQIPSSGDRRAFTIQTLSRQSEGSQIQRNILASINATFHWKWSFNCSWCFDDFILL